MRSTGTQWAKNSILAVDAGVHLSAIIRIIDAHLPNAVLHKPQETAAASTSKPKSAISRIPTPRKHHGPEYFSPVIEAQPPRYPSPAPLSISDGPKLVMTSGPFKDLLLPFETAKANALYLLRNHISTYLITHAHLDHLSGFAINTAAFQFTTRPKKLAALPQTINAIKQHIFNDIIWPNLSDEEGGVGLVSFQRLTEGGNLALGDGDGRGYVEVCDGLAVKGWGISHGHCMKPHTHRGSIHQDYSFGSPLERRGSRASIPLSPGYRRKSVQHSEYGPPPSMDACVVESSAYFILDEHTNREILVFGDVEPDSISHSPRTARVWFDAAPKIVAGLLTAIFIECSYDDSQSDETLFGHLTPRHLIVELSILAERVNELRAAPQQPQSDHLRKRKRNGSLRSSDLFTSERRSRGRGRTVSPFSRGAGTGHSSSRSSERDPHELDLDPPVPLHTKLKPLPNVSNHIPVTMSTPGTGGYFETQTQAETQSKSMHKALAGLRVVIIHVKDTLRDGEAATETVLRQLQERAEQADLGCEISIACQGECIWL